MASLRRFLEKYRLRAKKRMLALSGYVSQDGQDYFVAGRYFRGRRGGTFLDIGAHDGKTFSNTLFLEQRLGWRGVCVEANPKVFKELVRNRKCECLNSAVTSAPGVQTFLQITGYGEMLSGLVGSYSPEHRKRIENELRIFGGKAEEIELTCVTVGEVVERYGLKELNYVSVDTEGSELDIIESINFRKVSIELISFENNYADHSLGHFLNALGYHFLAKIGGDEFYGKKKP